MLHIICLREMQIETMRYPYSPSRMIEIQNNDNTKCWETVEQQEFSCITSINANDAATLEDNLLASY